MSFCFVLYVYLSYSHRKHSGQSLKLVSPTRIGGRNSLTKIIKRKRAIKSTGDAMSGRVMRKGGGERGSGAWGGW